MARFSPGTRNDPCGVATTRKNPARENRNIELANLSHVRCESTIHPTLNWSTTNFLRCCFLLLLCQAAVMPKPNQVVSDKVTATDTLALIDEVKTDPHTGKVIEEYGVKILRYKFGYRVLVNHPDKANARLEFFIQTAVEDQPVMTLNAGPDMHSMELRQPTDVDGFNIKVPREGPVQMITYGTHALDIVPAGGLTINGEALEAMIRRIVGEVIAS